MRVSGECCGVTDNCGSSVPVAERRVAGGRGREEALGAGDEDGGSGRSRSAGCGERSGSSMEWSWSWEAEVAEAAERLTVARGGQLGPFACTCFLLSVSSVCLSFLPSLLPDPPRFVPVLLAASALTPHPLPPLVLPSVGILVLCSKSFSRREAKQRKVDSPRPVPAPLSLLFLSSASPFPPASLIHPSLRVCRRFRREFRGSASTLVAHDTWLPA